MAAEIGTQVRAWRSRWVAGIVLQGWQHHGWRVKELKLAEPPEGQDERILMPAEVEVQ